MFAHRLAAPFSAGRDLAICAPPDQRSIDDAQGFAELRRADPIALFVDEACFIVFEIWVIWRVMPEARCESVCVLSERL